MRLNKINKKSRTVLAALAEGCSCEEILADDRNLTSHDIFRAISQVSTTFWKKGLAGRRGPRHRTD